MKQKVEKKKEVTFVAPSTQGGCLFGLFSSCKPTKSDVSISDKKSSHSKIETNSFATQNIIDEDNETLNEYHKGSIYSKDSFAEIESGSDKYVGKPRKHKRTRRKPQI